MPVTDSVGDFLTVIRNAARAKKEKVTLPVSKMTAKIAEILKEEGFLENAKVFSEGKKQFIRIHLKYIQGKRAAIQGIRRISKPGRRRYFGYQKIPRIQGGLGVAILSTSKGVVTDQIARKTKAGGELLCAVW